MICPHSHLSSVAACHVMSLHLYAIGQCRASERNRLFSSSLSDGSYTPNCTYSRGEILPRPRDSLMYSRAIDSGFLPLLRTACPRYRVSGPVGAAATRASRAHAVSPFRRVVERTSAERLGSIAAGIASPPSSPVRPQLRSLCENSRGAGDSSGDVLEGMLMRSPRWCAAILPPSRRPREWTCCRDTMQPIAGRIRRNARDRRRSIGIGMFGSRGLRRFDFATDDWPAACRSRKTGWPGEERDPKPDRGSVRAWRDEGTRKLGRHVVRWPPKPEQPPAGAPVVGLDRIALETAGTRRRPWIAVGLVRWGRRPPGPRAGRRPC